MITLEFHQRDEEESPLMEVCFKYGHDTEFSIEQHHKGEYYTDSASISISHSDLNKLGKAIIERLKDTPYKITL